MTVFTDPNHHYLITTHLSHPKKFNLSPHFDISCGLPCKNYIKILQNDVNDLSYRHFFIYIYTQFLSVSPMNRFLKWTIITLSIVALGLFVYAYFFEDIFSKRLSPKDIVKFELNDTKLEVLYNRPYKKNREIFGALVPFDQVWRTGANEATTFITNKDLMIEGKRMPKGEYTLWTIPHDTAWNVIFNTKQYPWGVDEQMRAMREPQFDLINIIQPVKSIEKPVEQFTIAFDNTTDELKMTLVWDLTKIEVPMEIIATQPQ